MLRRFNHNARSILKASKSLPRILLPPIHFRMVHVQLMLDWDGTLTRRDTIAEIAKIGYEVNERKGIKLRPWDEIVADYQKDSREYRESHVPKWQDLTSIEHISQYFAGLKAIDRASINRCVEAGVFRNITYEDLEEGAERAIRPGCKEPHPEGGTVQSLAHVELRTGWDKLFELKDRLKSERQHELDMSVVTVNWSANFILCVLGASEKPAMNNPDYLNDIIIHGNEIHHRINPSLFSAGSGRKYPTLEDPASNLIQTNVDKAVVVKRLISEAREKSVKARQKHYSIYVGDSSGDFDALLEVDFGICIRDQPMDQHQRELAELYERIGVNVVSLWQAQVKDLETRHERKKLYWTHDLESVVEFIEQKLLAAPKEGR